MVEHMLLRNRLRPVCLVETLPSSILQYKLSRSTTLHCKSLVYLPDTEDNRVPLASVQDHAEKLELQAEEQRFTSLEQSLAYALCSQGKRGQFGMLSIGGAEEHQRTRYMIISAIQEVNKDWKWEK